MGRAKKERKPKGNRANKLKNQKRIMANDAVLKQLTQEMNKQ
jgi:hypothetical protein